MTVLNSINETLESSYDDLVYEGRAFPQAHPERLCVIGSLFGLNPKPVEKCRVLEIGCATGENIIPMAFHLAESEFVGADISLVQIQKAQETINELGLENIKVPKADLMEIDESWGKFDYIISHGVYSWVPEEVENKILEISSQNLEKNGLVYISYGTFPGCSTKMMARDMILYHTKKFSDNQQKIEQAKALLEFIKSYAEKSNSYYKHVVQNHVNIFSSNKESYLFHEYIELFNRPSYFQDFINKAGKYGLAFVNEAQAGASSEFKLPPEINNTLNSICTTFEEKEQYFDFLENRSFRQSVLCADADKANISRDITFEQLKDMYCYLPAKILAPEEIVADNQMQEIRNISDVGIKSNNSLIKNAIKILCTSNKGCIKISDLFDNSFTGIALDEGVASHTQSQMQSFTNGILQGYITNFLGLSSRDFGYLLTVSQKPKVSKMALFQARNNLLIVNQRHEPINIDAFARKLVSHLDGNSTMDVVLSELDKSVQPDFKNNPDNIPRNILIENEANMLLDDFKLLGLLVG